MATQTHSPAKNKRKTTQTRAIEKLLSAAFPAAHIEAYRYNSASIRIRIIDPAFKGMSRIGREKKVLPLLNRLPEKTRMDITVLLLLTPDETSTSIMNLEFDAPTPSTL